MITAPAGCLICSAGAGACTGHPVTSASAVRPLDLPAPAPVEDLMTMHREKRTLPGGGTYYVNVADPLTPRGKARPAPAPAQEAPAVLLIGESEAAVAQAAEQLVSEEVPVTLIADGPAPVSPPPGARRRKG